ncbi:hypothetical protein ISU10_21635 [Nocardioides agariphilus]|uniref:Uncharacterized protein n=1 Tax=Nocardioides agariphilus TaxID=433664 RepID=A0A930VRB2_9ACTN|nr:hypothetical protein [Nocardioides agariphilus]MBF4770386.1 hypothetical protein [Nocardioides agariphilus]
MLPDAYRGLVDDAAVFPPGDAPLPEALTAYVERRDEWYADLVASFVVTDTALPEVEADVPVSIVVTGGAGGIAGPLGYAAKKGKQVAGVEIALRDLDDLPGNARRIVAAVEAARGQGAVADDVPVFVELPQSDATASWLAAADVVAESELRLKFRTGGLEIDRFPTPEQLASWIDAALDRETPFKCTAGLHHAIAHRDHETGFAHHGFLNVLLATRRAFDGAPVGEVASLLADHYPNDLVALARQADGSGELSGARRWFVSFGSCSVHEPLDDLVGLGLLEAPA